MKGGSSFKMRLRNGVYQILIKFGEKQYWCSIRYDDVGQLYIISPASNERLRLSREQSEYFKKYKINMKYSYGLLGEYMDFT